MGMRRLNPFIIVSFLLFSFNFFYPEKVAAVSNEPGDYLAAEDWDIGTPTSGFPDCGGPSWHGWECKNYDCDHDYQSELSTTIYYTPPRSYHQIRVQGQADTVDLIYTLPSPQTKIHLRMYIYFGQSFQNAHAGSNEEIIHFVFFNTANSGVNFSVDIWNYTDQPYDSNNYCPSGGDNGGIHFGFHTYHDDCVGDCSSNETMKGPAGNQSPNCWNIKDHLEEWHCYEFMWDFNTHTAKWWIDGNLKMERTPICACNHSSINKIILSGWNSCTSCRNHYEADFYIDNIVIDNKYIGPYVPSGAPARPSNLRIKP